MRILRALVPCALSSVLFASSAAADLLPSDTELCRGKKEADPCSTCDKPDGGTVLFSGTCANTTCPVGGGLGGGTPGKAPCTRCLGADGLPPTAIQYPCGPAASTDGGTADGGGGGGGGGGGCTYGRASEVGAFGLALLVPAISMLTRRRRKRTDASR